MSKTWSLVTNSNLSLDEVYNWLCSRSNWDAVGDPKSGEHRCIAESSDSGTTAIVIDMYSLKRGTAETSFPMLGSPCKILFEMSLSRERENRIGALDGIFNVVFEFASFDDCDWYFETESDGIAICRNGRCLVNPEAFYADSLASMLTQPYAIAEQPFWPYAELWLQD